MRTIIHALASALTAYQNCQKSGNEEWRIKHGDTMRNLLDMLPSGSGFDNGTHIDAPNSSAERIVLKTAFHHMDDNGYYCGWSEHCVIVTPSFDGFNLRITGRNVRDIKNFVADTFRHALSQKID